MKNDLISRSALLEYCKRQATEPWNRKAAPVTWADAYVAFADDIEEDFLGEDAVPVNDRLGEMLNWAVRYSLGRMSYAVCDTVSYVMPLIPKLDRRTLSVMQRDIEEAPSYGMECDKADWMRLLYAIREELKRRVDE